jgi:anti-sigma factor RsiW
MTPEEREELIAAYALGTLRGPEAAEIEELVRTDRAAARELKAYHELVDYVALSAPLRRADPAVRDRVMREARKSERITAAAGRWTQWQVAAILAAISVGVGAITWGVNLDRELDRQAKANAALAAVVEASAKQLENLAAAGVNAQVVQDQQVQLANAVADQELVIGISSDPSVVTFRLDPTAYGHGATARYLWSDEVGAGVLVARGLPDLPLDSVYQMWFDDGKRTFSVGTFTPDERSAVQKVVQLPAGANAPTKVMVAVAPIGGATMVGRLVVLQGEIEHEYVP